MPVRENCPLAVRQFQETDAEGSFGAGCLNAALQVGHHGVVHVIG